MTNDTVKQAEEKLRRAMWQVRSHRDLIGLGPMLDRMQDLVPNPRHPTIAVDGKSMMYNPEFINGLLASTIRTIIVHEAMHIGHSHHLRLKRSKWNPATANIAMDHVINNSIIQMKAFRDGFLGTHGIDQFWCCDPKYADASKWSTDAVYADIMANPPEVPDDEPGDQGKQGDEGDEVEVAGNPSPGGDDAPDEGEDPTGDGEGEEDPDTDDGEQEDPDTGEGEDSDEGEGGDEGEADDPPVTQCPQGTLGEVLPAPDEQTDEEDQQEHEDIQEDLARGEFMEKMMGDGSGGSRLLGKIRDATKEEPNEWGYLKDLLREEFSDTRTWVRPNPFHLQRHGYLPGRGKDCGDLVWWVDMSGSMTRDELRACYANGMAMCEELGIRRVYIGYFDGRVLQTEAMEAENTVFEVYEVGGGEEPEFTVMGRGGTIVDPCFQATEDEGIDVQCMIIFTDGQLVCHVDDPGYPVIWATTEDDPSFGSYYNDGVGFGEIVKIKARRWWEKS